MNVSGSSSSTSTSTRSTFLKNHRQVRRFSLRDGFHLSKLNEEKRKQIDDAILLLPSSTENTSRNQNNNNNTEEEKIVLVEAKEQIQAIKVHMDGEITRIFDLIQRQPPEMICTFKSSNPITSTTGSTTSILTTTSTSISPRIHSSSCTLPEENHQWLLYRRERISRKDKDRQVLDKMIDEELQISSSKDLSHQVRTPSPPTFSTTTSTSLTTTLSTRKKRQLQQQSKPQTNVNVPILIPIPVTTVSEEQEVVQVTPSVSVPSDAPRLSTASALKTKSLSSRIEELRACPQITDQILEETRQRKLQQFKCLSNSSTQKNLIERNKQMINQAQPNFELSQQKREQALRRKAAIEIQRQEQIEKNTGRWEKKKIEELHQYHFLQFQKKWLLTLYLCQSGQMWLSHLKKLDVKINLRLFNTMAKKIQRFWRRSRLISKAT
jgi:hypothetical protein